MAKRTLSTKTYPHSIGLSCCFRQWRATHSHCQFLHGYSLEVRLEFEGALDDRNWVVDFGDLKEIKRWLEDTFDHKTLVALDDPKYAHFQDLHRHKIIQMVTVEHVGCEKFAEHIFDHVSNWLATNEKTFARVLLNSVEVKEHAGNSAIVKREGI